LGRISDSIGHYEVDNDGNISSSVKEIGNESGDNYKDKCEDLMVSLD
jgi:hypothetical protein